MRNVVYRVDNADWQKKKRSFEHTVLKAVI